MSRQAGRLAASALSHLNLRVRYGISTAGDSPRTRPTASAVGSDPRTRPTASAVGSEPRARSRRSG